MKRQRVLKARQKLGKYKLEKKLGEGGFAVVWKALDTIEGVRVALKIPHEQWVTDEVLDDFRREVRLAASLNHANILPLKNAEFIDGHFVVAFPLAEQTLSDRLRKRLSLAMALDFGEQMLEAIAYAHEQRIIHCDIKPDNLLLFPDGWLMLTDFGIAKVALNTIRASGSGTVGFVAPEQAMGRPSIRSDVFSAGLVLYRMLSGKLPEWPFAWPPEGYERIRKLEPDMVALLRRALSVDPKRRYADGNAMLNAFRKAKAKTLRNGSMSRTAGGKTSAGRTSNGGDSQERDWRTMRFRQFQRDYGKVLETRLPCEKCTGPVSEWMTHCPWCGDDRGRLTAETQMPRVCPRCCRGLKADWAYCPWCYGAGFEVETKRQYSDRRYVAKCRNNACERRDLMRFMRYCPWCRQRVKRPWKIPESKETCGRCGWGLAAGYWAYCPWCGKAVHSPAKKSGK